MDPAYLSDYSEYPSQHEEKNHGHQQILLQTFHMQLDQLNGIDPIQSGSVFCKQYQEDIKKKLNNIQNLIDKISSQEATRRKSTADK